MAENVLIAVATERITVLVLQREHQLIVVHSWHLERDFGRTRTAPVIKVQRKRDTFLNETVGFDEHGTRLRVELESLETVFCFTRLVALIVDAQTRFGLAETCPAPGVDVDGKVTIQTATVDSLSSGFLQERKRQLLVLAIKDV